MSMILAQSGSTGSAGGITPSPRRPAATIGGDVTTFLQLLTTQLRNQDPTNAMDVNTMTAQLVAFAGVEQQIAMNRQLGQLLALQQGAQLTAAAGLIGRSLEVESPALVLQEGQATLRLPAAGAARWAVVKISDAAGRLLREASVPLGPDRSTWRWDGRDSAGRPLPDGSYAVTVSGRDAMGGELPIEVGVIARATGAERSGDGVRLRFGTLSLPLDRLRGLAG
ncbi:MAG: hypothetical protein NZN45_07560 [Rhodovarius sp.]|nr:hypothetical protein [Rhodovarius sp.]